jgi:hypothetical protein
MTTTLYYLCPHRQVPGIRPRLSRGAAAEYYKVCCIAGPDIGFQSLLPQRTGYAGEIPLVKGAKLPAPRNAITVDEALLGL